MAATPSFVQSRRRRGKHLVPTRIAADKPGEWGWRDNAPQNLYCADAAPRQTHHATSARSSRRLIAYKGVARAAIPGRAEREATPANSRGAIILFPDAQALMPIWLNPVIWCMPIAACRSIMLYLKPTSTTS